jgi:hypothetical protein
MSNVENNNDEQNESPGIKALRQQAAEGADAKAEAAQMKKEMAFLRAGIDTTSKPAQAMIAGFTGELTPDAIAAEAAEWGLAKPPTPPPTQGDPGSDPNSPEAQQQAVREQASGKPAPIIEAPGKSAMDEAIEGFHENRARGMNREAAEEEAFAAVIFGAGTGDKSAIFDPVAWADEKARAGHGTAPR